MSVLRYPSFRDGLIFVLLFVCAGFLQVFYPREIVWDLLNYHYYNPWAFFHHRLGYDIAPAMINTYFNPLIDIPYYLMLNVWGDGAFIKFVQGSYYGVLLFVFYKIVGLFFDFRKEPVAFLTTIAIGATGFSCLSQAGTSSNEIQVSILIMIGFYLICKHIGCDVRSRKVWVISGLLMGAALGLKPTVITYCVAMGLSLILFMKPLRVSVKEVMIFTLSGLVGYIIVNGWWMWQLYSHFDNPFFPFLNKIFKSEYFDFINYRDMQYIERTSNWQKIFLPYFISFLSYEKKYVSEVSFFDLRYALTYTIVIGMFIVWLCRGCKFSAKRDVLLYIFLSLSYVIWLNLFSIIRYAIPLEMLSSVVIVKFFYKIRVKSQFLLVLLVSFEIIGFYILVSEAPYNVRAWFYHSSTTIEPINLPKNTLVKTYGYPIAMIAAKLVGDQSHRIVSYANGTIGDNVAFVEYRKLAQIRSEVEKNHKGPIVSLIAYNVNNSRFDVSMKLALRQRKKQESEGNYCRYLRQDWDIVVICVPQNLKDSVFIEEEKKVHIDVGGQMTDFNQMKELNEILN